MSTTEPVVASLPKGFLRPCVLLLLREQPVHGYELLERLGALGFDRSDPGGLYRTLRGLEKEGFVHSSWEKSAAGPDRRIYELTRAGGEELHRHAKAVAAGADLLAAFVSRYEEFVKLRRPARRRAASGARG
jgi:PadR family transcriptional regulator, regulatory protein PadR